MQCLEKENNATQLLKIVLLKQKTEKIIEFIITELLPLVFSKLIISSSSLMCFFLFVTIFPFFMQSLRRRWF